MPNNRKPRKEHKWNYYEVDLWTGRLAKHRAKSDLDLSITLANGDCKKTYEEAMELSSLIVIDNERRAAMNGGQVNAHK